MPTLQGQNILNYFRIRMFIQMLNNNLMSQIKRNMGWRGQGTFGPSSSILSWLYPFVNVKLLSSHSFQAMTMSIKT